VLADRAVRNDCDGVTLQGTFDRMMRWAMLRARVQPLAYLLEPLSSPVMIGVSALLLPNTSPWLLPGLMAWSTLLMTARDFAAGYRIAQPPTQQQLLFAPLREWMWLLAWLVALGHRHVSWRGHRLRVSAGTRLYRTARV
jgi:hypothetical protein